MKKLLEKQRNLLNEMLKNSIELGDRKFELAVGDKVWVLTEVQKPEFQYVLELGVIEDTDVKVYDDCYDYKVKFNNDRIVLVDKDDVAPESKGDWVFDRSSGYGGYRCLKCMTWVYADNPKQCICDR